MRKSSFFYLACVCACIVLSISACSDDDDKTKVIKRQVETTVGKMCAVTASVEDGKTVSGTWTVEPAADPLVVMRQTDSGSVQFLSMREGSFRLTFSATGLEESVTVTVKPADISPYIAHVVDFCPAPGQFINVVPQWSDGMSHAQVVADADARLAGMKQGSDISLGGFGGYIDLAFDHTIMNVEGERDFRILGNAFYSDEVETLNGYLTGSSEPGVVMVALDKNGNGRPDDDEWYEIAGSEHGNSKTIRNYSITYFKPETEANDPDYNPGKDFITIKKYLRWTDNQGGDGYIQKNSFHTQTYYPGWLSSSSLTLKGTRLPDNAVDTKGDGSYYVRYCYEWGYADAMPNTHEGSAIDIGWAVDAQGNKVNLIGADFVRVYTGINQDCGWIGETSTEVSGAYDLHMEK